MTFKHLGLVVAARDGATPFKWGKETYSLTGDFDMLDKFVDGFMQFSADHLRPQRGCALGDIEKYCHRLMEKFADILDLTKHAREKYIGPHAFRKYFMRLETQTYTTPIDEYYSTLGEPEKKCSTDNKMAYWTTKTVADITSLAPDSRGYLCGLKADLKLSSVATEYGMHPLMVPCWTCLIGKLVGDFGEARAKKFLRSRIDSPP